MSPTTTGFVVLDIEETTLSELAQSTGRMRGIDYDQSALFVVIGKHQERLGGMRLYLRLLATEKKRALVSHGLGWKQAQRARIAKSSRDDFNTPIQYEVADTPTENIQTQHQQERQEQLQEHKDEQKDIQDQQNRQDRGKKGGCLQATISGGFMDKMNNITKVCSSRGAFDSFDSKHRVSIQVSLDQLGISISPMFACRDIMDGPENFYGSVSKVSTFNGFIELAFAIYEPVGESDRPKLRIMTQAEVWAEAHAGAVSGDSAERVVQEDKLWNTGGSYYSRTGKPIYKRVDKRGADNQALIKLGRFLCNDRLRVHDEIEVMVYLSGLDARDEVKHVVNCFYDYKIITRPNTFLHRLHTSGELYESILRELTRRDENQTTEQIIQGIIKQDEPGFAIISGLIRPGIAKITEEIWAMLKSPRSAFGKAKKNIRSFRIMSKMNAFV
jgi:hypothetical protein